GLAVCGRGTRRASPSPALVAGGAGGGVVLRPGPPNRALSRSAESLLRSGAAPARLANGISRLAGGMRLGSADAAGNPVFDAANQHYVQVAFGARRSGDDERHAARRAKRGPVVESAA